MKKQVVIDLLDTLPDEFELELLVGKILFIKDIEKGLMDVSENRIISLEGARKRFDIKD